MSAGPPPPDAPAAPSRVVVRRKGDRGALYGAIAAVVIVALLVGVGYSTSWYGLRSAPNGPGCPTGVTLQGAGANFPAAIVSQWTTGYASASSNSVNYQSVGAGQGITDITDKSVDFAVTDEGLTTSQSSALTGAVGTFLTVPVTGGAVVLVYTLSGFTGTLKLTGAELAAIYLGTVTTWNATELVANNPGLADVNVPITAVHRLDSAGMTYVFTNLLSDDNQTWNTSADLGTSLAPAWPTFTGAEGADGNSVLLTDVKTNGAIGYTDLYDAQEKSLSYAAIENPQGQYITPTVADTAAAIDHIYNRTAATLPAITGDWSTVSWVDADGSNEYPVAALVYLLVPQDPAKGHTASATDAAALRQFLSYVLTKGQTYSTTEFPFVSPPAALLTEGQAALGALNYNGASFQSCTY
jgi:phosphate transport system substrate-binding protein